MLKITYLLGIGMALLSACSGNQLGASATARPNEVGTAVALGVQQTEESKAVEQTEAARPTATSEINMEATLTRAAVISAFVRSGPETATAQVEEAKPIMEQLVAGGYIFSTEGVFRKLEDADKTYSKRDWFWWFEIGMSPTDFVWHAVVTMDTRETNASTAAGCGFAFRKRETGAGSYVLLDFNGGVRYGALGSDFWNAHGINSNVGVNTSDPVEFLLVVQDDGYVFFINGEEVLNRRGIPEKGEIKYLVSAGSVTMNCTYEDVWVWSLRG